MELSQVFIHFILFMNFIDGTVSATTITNVTLIDGQTRNEGRVEYIRLDASTWQSACGDGLGYDEASVICRQLGYPGVNNYIAQWPFGMQDSIAQQSLRCDGDEEDLADCSLLGGSPCSNAGGVICYDFGYLGCYLSSGMVLGDLQSLVEYGLDDSECLPISNCISLCQGTNVTYTYAGLYNGDTCLCGNASTNISQSDRVDDSQCNSPCAGRNIERCGGISRIAVFNISRYLTSKPMPLPSVNCSSSPTITAAPEASPSVSSLPSQSATPASSSSPLSSSSLSALSSLLSSSSSTALPVSSSTVTIPPTTHLQSSQTSTQASSSSSGSNTIRASELGLYIGVGVAAGILVLIIIIFTIVFIRRCRGSKDKASSDERNTLEMRPGPEGSDWDNRPPAASPNDYSLGNGHTNTAANGVTAVEDSTYSMIAETDMDPRNNAPNSSAYEDVPPLDSTSGSRRPPQPAPRKSVKEAQDTPHPDASELYSKPNKDQLKNRQPNSLPEYAVLEKEPMGQEDVKVPPSALNSEDIAGLYTMPDKSKKSTNGLHTSGTALDNALYICRGEADGAREVSEYAIDKDDAKVGGNEQGDEDTEMIENELYETSNRYA